MSCNRLVLEIGLLFLLVGTLAACGGGGGGSSVGVGPIDASVLTVTWPVTPTGDVALDVELQSADGAPLDLGVERSVDGGLSWQPATMVDPAALVGLAAGVGGTTHVVLWDSVADVGPRGSATAELRFTPRRTNGIGTARVVGVPAIDNRRAASKRVDHYIIHYGFIDPATVRVLETYELAVVHPFNSGIDVATVADIQDGVDANDPADDVLVLAYISIGEDLRTIGLSDAQMLLDPRFVGDGTGPRIDPRGPDGDGQPLTALDPLGLPSNGGTGFASWYLDDNSVDQDPGDVGDGSPDRNGIFGGCFVNAGDPMWFDVLDQMTFDGPDGMPGLQELLTSTSGRGYACDGVFLDTVDTCAPNHFTDSLSPNQSEFEWTAAGFRDFMVRLRTAYPDRLVFQNRGLFCFDPRQRHYEVTPRAAIDLLLFESYRLDSNSTAEFDTYFFPDNKHNLAPKLMAEAGRPDGFKVLSLGYAEGPPGAMSVDTLTGGSVLGFDSLLEDIYETQDLAGFRHYLTDAGLTVANDFVRQHADLSDALAPTWTSTFNDNQTPFPIPAPAATPRIGIQAADAGPGCVTVRWDVALDLHPVGYALYHQTAPFDFVGDPTLASATRVVLTPNAGSGYGPDSVSPGYPNEDVVDGFTPGTTVHLCIRAFDALGNEEQNEVALTATPLALTPITIDGVMDDWAAVPLAHADGADVADSSGPDWLSIWITNDDTNLYVRFTSENAFNLDGSPGSAFSRTLVMIDVDDNPGTGYPFGGLGSELLVSGAELYAQDADNFNDGFVTALSASPAVGATDVELAIPLAEIYARAADASNIRLVFLNDEVNDQAPNVGALTWHILKPKP